MKAVVYRGKKDVAVEEVPDPILEDPRDVIVKVTSAAICGSDLHVYDGRTDAEEGTVLGHEIMGVIDEVGEAVSSVNMGDRVVLPFNISCGLCMNCLRGYTSACLTTNPENPGAAYGYPDMGPYQGGQAEYVRVPFADFNTIKLPGTPGDEYENDFLMLADIFPTGYHATELAGVEPGTSVAIYGAGPVGLLAAHSAIVRGAAEVYVVDRSEERLDMAERIGATTINFEDGDPTEQIKEIRRTDPLIQESFKPGEEKMEGVMCGIDAVGYQALNTQDPSEEDSMAVMKQLVEIVNPTGSIGIVGVYRPSDPEGVTRANREGMFEFPLGKAFAKGLSVRMGQTPVKKYANHLRNLIISGRAKPGMIVSHTLPLEDAPEAYELFDFRGVGEGSDYTKIVLNP